MGLGKSAECTAEGWRGDLIDCELSFLLPFVTFNLSFYFLRTFFSFLILHMMEWTVVCQKSMDQTKENAEEDLNRMADKKQR